VASGYIGLMSGTSLDGVDGILAEFEEMPRILRSAYSPFPYGLRDELLALQRPGPDELHRASLAAIALTELYAEVVGELVAGAQARPAAIGCHGQTVRHRPDAGYTVQLNNGARLAELTGLTVVTDFRSRDIAAGGQGAPLVPAFHAAAFGDLHEHRVVVNIGGIANVSDLDPQGDVRGWDTGPGNLLLDGWCQRHRGTPYDDDGAWSVSGHVLPELLDRLLDDPYFAAHPPKSTGRDHFHLDWLAARLAGMERPEDVQATLLMLTARTISDAIVGQCASARRVFVCGGGARNGALMGCLAKLLGPREVAAVDALGIPSNHVEATAFAWLARQALLGAPGNLPAVTGARGLRILGAVYPA
jgi:anhydro-N-acetylmuramic acid kinase